VILVDTSVWVRHLRRTDARLVRYLGQDQVVTTLVIRGELMLGAGLPPDLGQALLRLPAIPTPTPPATLDFISRHRRTLVASGIGWADAAILLAAMTAGTLLYSADRPMREAWQALGRRLA
jgi:predicted nucleic acid-binding protein